jgi:sugar phosphate permease
MQAAGLIVGPLLAAALLSSGLSPDLIWRILVAFGAVPAMAVYWQRRRLKETPRFLAASAQQNGAEGGAANAGKREATAHSVSFWDGFHRLVNDNKLLVRLVGASAAWFLMDAAYYGNTVSSPLVLSALKGDHTLLEKTLTQLTVFAVFALPGYIVAVLTMDRAGRKTIQVLGFAMMAVMFAILALKPDLQKAAVPFLTIYGLSYFFTEFGPNATTFIYPSEIFPVRVRTTGHGVAAAMGKLGGFLGVFLFPFLLHWKGLLGAESAAAIASVLGLIVTLLTLPETKGRSLEAI